MNRIFRLTGLIGIIVVLGLWYFFEVRIIESMIILTIFQMVLGNIVTPLINERINKDTICNNSEVIVLTRSEEKAATSVSSNVYFPQGAIITLFLLNIVMIIAVVLSFKGGYAVLAMLVIIFLLLLSIVLFSLFKKLSLWMVKGEIRFTFVDSYGKPHREIIHTIKVAHVKEIKLFKSKALDNDRTDSVYAFILFDGSIWYASFRNFSNRSRNAIRTDFERMLGIS